MRLSLIRALVTIKNGCRLNKNKVSFRFSFAYFKILTILYHEGFIQSFRVDITNLRIDVHLRFFYSKNVFNKIKFLSVPSHHRSISFFDLSKIPTKKIFLLLSTDKGLLNLSECKKQKIGGKLLFSIF